MFPDGLDRVEFSGVPLDRFPEEEPFEGGSRVSAADQFDSLLICGKGVNSLEKFRGGIAEDDLGLVLDSDQVVEASLLHEGSLMDDAHPVTNFLDLLQEVGAEEDGESTILQLEDEITDLTGADRVDPGSWFVEDN